jgi:hypothetical protein
MLIVEEVVRSDMLRFLLLWVFVFFISGCEHDPRSFEEKMKDQIEAEKFEMQLRTDREKRDWKEYKDNWNGAPPMSPGVYVK